MGSLKIAALTLLCILALSDAGKKSTLKGTVHLKAPDDFTEPAYVRMIVQVASGKKQEILIKWNECDKAKRTCPYIVKNIPQSPGKYCDVGINLRYGTNIGPMNAHTHESVLVMTGENVLLKNDGSNQDFEYDITKAHPTTRVLHEGHDRVAGETQSKGSVYMEGTLSFEHTEGMPETEDVVVLVSVSGNQLKDASESAKIPWKQCFRNKKCDYSVKSVPAHKGQKCTIGVRFHYTNENENDRDTWTKKNILVIKGDITKQDLNYNYSTHELTLEGDAVSDTRSTSASTSSKAATSSARETTSSSSSASSSGNKKITVNVQGTVEFEHDDGFPFNPDGILIQLKLDGESNGHKEADLAWFGSDCSNNKCTFTIPDVNAAVDQTYKIGINTYTNNKKKHEGMVWSNNSLALKMADNKLDIKYNISTHTFTLAAANDTASTSSSASTSTSSASSSSSSSPDKKAMTKITVKGDLHITIPSNIPKPDDIILYFELDQGETVHAIPMGWPTKCPGNKCPYAVKDVAAPGPGQKYIMNVSLHYKYFGSNSGEPDNRLAWSRVFTVAQAGENTVNLKYDAGVPNLLRG